MSDTPILDEIDRKAKEKSSRPIVGRTSASFRSNYDRIFRNKKSNEPKKPSNKYTRIKQHYE